MEDHSMRRLSRKGFLLIELIIALAVGLLLFGIGVYWKCSIFTMYQEAQQRIEAMNHIHTLLARMHNNSALVRSGRYENEVIQATWQFSPPTIESNLWQIPFINVPRGFMLVEVAVSWSKESNTQKKHSISLLTGALCNV